MNKTVWLFLQQSRDDELDIMLLNEDLLQDFKVMLS